MYPTYYIDGLYFSTFHADVKVTCVHTYRQPKIVACEFFPKEGTNFQTKVSMLKSDCKVFYLSVRSTYTRRFAWKNLAKIKKRKKNIRNSMSMSIFVPFFKQIDLCETTNVVHLRSIWCFLQVSQKMSKGNTFQTLKQQQKCLLFSLFPLSIIMTENGHYGLCINQHDNRYKNHSSCLRTFLSLSAENEN